MNRVAGATVDERTRSVLGYAHLGLLGVRKLDLLVRRSVNLLLVGLVLSPALAGAGVVWLLTAGFALLGVGVAWSFATVSAGTGRGRMVGAGLARRWNVRRWRDALASMIPQRHDQTAVETPVGQDLRRNGESSETVRPFPLLRYLTGATLAVMLAVTVVVASLFVGSAERRSADQSADRSTVEAAHIAHIFYYTVWLPVHMDFPDLSFGETAHPKMMDVFARRSTFGLNVVGLNVWGLDGTLAWSSDPTSTDRRVAADWYDTVVNEGTPFSELLRDQQVTDLDGEQRRLHVVRTYYPFRDAAPDSPETGEIVGVLEITQDTTAALESARSSAIRLAVWGSLGTLAVLSALLFLIILKADRSNARGFQRLHRQRADLQESQSHKIQSAKLAGIGQLVAGVAHELNNPLTSIWSLAQVLVERKDRDLDERLKRELSMIHQEAERSVGIVQNLLSFARARGTEKAYTSINAAIEAALELRRYHLMVNNIDLRVQLQPDLPRTMADPHKIQQVVLNLIINAEHAMLEASSSGRLVVKSAKGDETIRIMVSDDGPGISQEYLDHIFDPFFTTKSVGTGTGLGLSICYSIIREHGGTIRAESKSKKGATFIVELPIMESEDSIGIADPVEPAIPL